MAKTATKSEPPISATENAPVLGGIVPYLTVNGATKAAAFYAKAFAAEEVGRHPVDDKGRTMHIHLHINGSSVMLSDPFPEYGHPLKAPESFNITLMVEDIQTWWDRAVKAGAEVVMPLQDMFWGDRYGQLRDPFGVMWAMNAPIR